MARVSTPSRSSSAPPSVVDCQPRLLVSAAVASSAGGRDVTDGFGVAGGTGGAEPVVCQFTDAIARSAGGEILEGFGDAFVRSSPPVR